MKFLLFIGSLILVLIFGCNKKCNTPPMGIILRIYDKNNVDLLSPLVLGNYKDSLVLFYKGNSSTTYTIITAQIEQHTDANHQTSYQLSIPTIGYISWDPAQTKTFYLRRAKHITDTLFADYNYDVNGGCQKIMFKELKFNNVHINEVDDNTGYYFKAIGKNPGK